MNQQLKEPQRKTISAEDFINRVKPRTEQFDVPELGGVILLRGISLKERDAITSGARDFQTDKIDNASFAALTLLHGVVEPKLQANVVNQLKEANVGLIERIAKRIWELSGVKYEKDGNAGTEEAAKNA